MFCKNCGTQLKDGAAFCTNCGMKIVPVGQGGTGETQRPVPPIKPQEYDSYELPVKSRKSLQIPIIIAAVLIVAVIGCLVTVLVLRERDPDESMTVQSVTSKEDELDDDSDDEPVDEPAKEQELPVEDEGKIAQEVSGIDEPAEEVSQYILPNSDSAYLSHSDLIGLTREECRLARNELYARHGRKFDDEGLQNYFNEKDWYTGYVDPADFSDSVLNDYEIANRDLIVQYEEEMGYR